MTREEMKALIREAVREELDERDRQEQAALEKRERLEQEEQKTRAVINRAIQNRAAEYVNSLPQHGFTTQSKDTQR